MPDEPPRFAVTALAPVPLLARLHRREFRGDDLPVRQGRKNPSLIGFRSDEIRRTLSFDTDFEAG